MDKELFLRWLLETRKLASKAAGDVVSRCKRVESSLNQTLEKTTISQVMFDAALTRIRGSHPNQNDLLYAMRLYAAFKNPEIDLKRYFFYGASKRKRRAVKTSPCS